MTDSPVFRGTIVPEEQPILDKLLHIRDRLLILKSDKTQYVKSQDVIAQYEQVLDQIGALNNIRTNEVGHENRLDTVLDDCLQLISLFFLTIGRNAEAPAAYSVASTIKRLLDHLKEAGFYTHKDLTSIAIQLNKIQDSVERGRANHSSHMLTLLENRVNNCKATLAELEGALSQLSPELEPTHEKLVSILRSLSGLNLKPKFPAAEVKEFQRQLREIEAGLDGEPVALPESAQTAEEQYTERLRHISYDKNSPLPGREVVVALLGRCLLWSEIMMHRKGKMQESFRPIFDNLHSIYKQLEKLSLTQAWSLRETDLYGYQRRLDRVDESRVNGGFVDAEGKTAEIFEDRAMLYLLRKSYATIFFMITSSEPVSEALLPIYNQLTTLKRCLVEVKKSGGVNSPREIYPYSMKLNSIDNMRHDGKFMVNGEIPEGQGSVIALLSECFDLAYELRVEAENEVDDQSDSDNDDGHYRGTTGSGADGQSTCKDLNGGGIVEPEAHQDHAFVSGAGNVADTSKAMSGLTIEAK